MIYGYVRVSTENQRDNYSTDVQRDKIQEFAKWNNDDYRIYDEVASAKSIGHRPELQRLLADIQRDKYDKKKVWVVEQTRLARDVTDSDSILKLFQKYNVELYVNSNLVDLSVATNRLVYGINSVVAAHERQQTGERVKRAKKEVADQGAYINSALLGYTRKFHEDGTRYWVIDDDEARIVRKIFRDYLDGVSVNRIASELNRLGFKTKRGKKFEATTVAKLLNHPYYFGEGYDSEGKVLASKVYKPLLNFTKEEFLAARALRKPKADKFKNVRKDVTGIIRCKACGAPYYIHRKGGKQEKYTYLHHHESAKKPKCSQMPKYIDLEVTASLLETFYENSIRDARFLKFLILKEQFDRPTVKSIEEEASRLDQVIAGCEERKSKLLRAVEEGAFSMDDIKERVRSINSEIEKVKALRIEENEKMRSFYVGATPSDGESERRIEIFRDSDAQTRHRDFLYILNSCEIDGDTVTIVRADKKAFQWKVNEESQFFMATIPLVVPTTIQERSGPPTPTVICQPFSLEEAWTFGGIDLTFQGHLLTDNDS